MLTHLVCLHTLTYQFTLTSSMLTSVQPWSGHFDTLPVVWATAHVTQFTEIGWQYLKVRLCTVTVCANPANDLI